VTVLSANMLHKADEHEMATFFLSRHRLVTTDRVPSSGGSHFSAVICKVGLGSVTTGYLVNAGVTGHEKNCPPVHWALVRWRIRGGSVQHLDPIPHTLGCWPRRQRT